MCRKRVVSMDAAREYFYRVRFAGFTYCAPVKKE